MSLASEQLDRRFRTIAAVLDAMTRPRHGWIRALRETLGMTGRQLGTRMGLSQSRITEMEAAERDGKITVRSLERAAEALGCRLVYVLVPVKPLSTMIEEQAAKVAARQFSHVLQTMALEDQSVGDEAQQELMKRELIDSLLKTKGRIWEADDGP